MSKTVVIVICFISSTNFSKGKKNFGVDADVKMSMHRIPNGLKNVNNHNNVARK